MISKKIFSIFKSIIGLFRSKAYGLIKDINIEKNVLIKKSGFSEKEIHIGENVWIGANVVILKGVKIGNNVIIGAGIVVRESVPSNHLLSHKGLMPLR